MKKALGWLVVLAIGMVGWLVVTGNAAHAATCATRTTVVAKTLASGEREATRTVLHTCTLTKAETFAGSYVYGSGERATVARTEAWVRDRGAWVIKAERQVRTARYATGRVTTTTTVRNYCNEKVTTQSVSSGASRTTTTIKRVC
jgi:hypothetical protein